MVDSVSAWGPGHPVIDRIEAEALAEVLGMSRHPIFRSTRSRESSAIPWPPQDHCRWLLAIISFATDWCLPRRTWRCRFPKPRSILYAERLGAVSRKLPLLNAHGVGGANVTLLLKAPQTSRLRLHQLKPNLMKPNSDWNIPQYESPHSVLVAFAHDGLRSALNVVEALEPYRRSSTLLVRSIAEPPLKGAGRRALHCHG